MQGKKTNPRHVPPRLKSRRYDHWEPPTNLPRGYTAFGGSQYGRFSVQFLGEHIGFIEREDGGKKWNIKPDLNGKVLDSRTKPDTAVFRLHQLWPAECERKRLEEEKFQAERRQAEARAKAWQLPIFPGETREVIPGVLNAHYNSRGEVVVLEVCKALPIVYNVPQTA